MRTTLELDDELMRALMARHPSASKRMAVERAIRDYLSRDAAERVRTLAGSFPVEDVSAELRAVDRSS